jgi:hypothetical protein
MSISKCDSCDYTSDKPTNIRRHMTTCKLKKYKDAIRHECKYCNDTFSTSNGLNRHMALCEPKNYEKYIVKTEMKIIQLESIIKLKDDALQEKVVTIQKCEDHIKYYQDLFVDAGGVLKESLSTLSSLIKKYKDPPILQSLEDYTVIHKDKSADDFVQTIRYNYDNGILHKYLGDFIILQYKTNGTFIQTLWNSDTTRLTYIFSKCLNNANKWYIDKKGVETTQIVIRPLLDYIVEIIDIVLKKPIKIKTLDTDALAQRIIFHTTLNKIKLYIEQKKLEGDILKHMAPHFKDGNKLIKNKCK